MSRRVLNVGHRDVGGRSKPETAATPCSLREKLVRGFSIGVLASIGSTPLSGWGAGNLWASLDNPTGGRPAAIGQTNNGCIAGAERLPPDGIGLMVMHLERRRYYGHPTLIQSVRELGKQAARNGLGLLQIGDLAQPRGGPMPSGHRSHQTGLDVDVWFNLDPRLHTRVDAQRANVGAPSLLNGGKNGLDYRIWNHGHTEMLRIAANLPEADRIFVNPHIKRELCRTVRGNRAWLRKIRPWYGHDDHFHMRLVCPEDSPRCIRQDALPPGDGCDASLDWWFEAHPPAPDVPKPPSPPLPPACRYVLNQ